VAAEKAEGSRYSDGWAHRLLQVLRLQRLGDVVAVVENCRTLLDLTEEDLKRIARDSRPPWRPTTKWHLQFSMSVFPGTEKDQFARLHMVFSRHLHNPVLPPPDTTALRTLYNESICVGFRRRSPPRFRPEFVRRNSNRAALVRVRRSGGPPGEPQPIFQRRKMMQLQNWTSPVPAAKTVGPARSAG